MSDEAEEHEISLEHSRKLDSRDLWVARCSCGEYVSAPGTEAGARRAGNAHVGAKTP